MNRVHNLQINYINSMNKSSSQTFCQQRKELQFDIYYADKASHMLYNLIVAERRIEEIFELNKDQVRELWNDTIKHTHSIDQGVLSTIMIATGCLTDTIGYMMFDDYIFEDDTRFLKKWNMKNIKRMMLEFLFETPLEVKEHNEITNIDQSVFKYIKSKLFSEFVED